MSDDLISLNHLIGKKPIYEPPEEPASDPEYIKHVICEGARFHVLRWNYQGTHCSEKRCIVNKDHRL